MEYLNIRKERARRKHICTKCNKIITIGMKFITRTYRYKDKPMIWEQYHTQCCSYKGRYEDCI